MSDSDQISDAELVARVNRGESAAFGALYERHRDWAVRLAYRLCGNREDALDVLQDAFLYLLSRFPGFRLTGSLRSYLYAVIANAVTTRGRRRARGALSAGGWPDGRGQPGRRFSGGAQTGDQADLGDLAVVLNGLRPAQREVLLLRFADELTVGEIAAALQIPVGTVKSRLHAALHTLRSDERTRRYFEA